ncbi:NAD(P)-binding protein, partial [Pleomassaria siparia CBS 279.74]
LDVTSDITIASAASTVEKTHGRLDMLINNAAIALAPGPGTLRSQLDACFATNATGPAVVVEAFLPLLRKSAHPGKRIVNVSSGAGSISRRLDPASAMYGMKGGWQYRASKAALNMLNACMAVECAELGIKVLAYDPGFTQSNLSPHNTAESGARSADESVEPLVEVIEGQRDAEWAQGMLHNSGSYGW